jgi:hypothetical protein
MKRRKASNTFIIQFLKEHCPKETVDAWKTEENQTKWKTTLLPKKPGDKEKYYSCYILYGFDNRDRLRKANPTMTMVEITCLLAKYWRIHKEANDTTYQHYKSLFEQMAFVRKHRRGLVERYPDKTEDEIDNLLMKMYAKWTGE